MDRFHIALFIHIVTLIAAASATAVTKLAVGRRMRARTVAEALDWHTVLISSARVFPACIVSFLVTGFYMMSVTGGGRMSLGYIDAGIVGVTLLLASGAYLGKQGATLTQVLKDAVARDVDAAPPRVKPPLLVRVLPMVNTGLALGVTFAMVTKPTSIPVALGIVALGGGLAAAAALRAQPPAGARAPVGKRESDDGRMPAL